MASIKWQGKFFAGEKPTAADRKAMSAFKKSPYFDAKCSYIADKEHGKWHFVCPKTGVAFTYDGDEFEQMEGDDEFDNVDALAAHVRGLMK